MLEEMTACNFPEQLNLLTNSGKALWEETKKTLDKVLHKIAPVGQNDNQAMLGDDD